MAATALRHAAEVYAAAAEVSTLLERLVAPAVAAGAADAREQLDRLVRPGFVTAAGAARLPDIVRYVKGIAHRLSKLPEDPHRDAARLREVAALETRYVRLLRRLDRDEVTPEVIELGWQLEDLRLATFAQQLGGAKGVSPQKVAKALHSLGG
jgi:ATP-dependent helicase HrpA